MALADEFGDIVDGAENLVPIDLGRHAGAPVVEQPQNLQRGIGIHVEVMHQPLTGLAGADDDQIARQPASPLP